MTALMEKLREMQRWINEQPQSEIDEMVITIHPDDMDEAVTYDWFAAHVKASSGELFGAQYTETQQATRGDPRVTMKLSRARRFEALKLLGVKLSAPQQKMLSAAAAAQSMVVPYRPGANRTAKSLHRLGLIQMWQDTNSGSHLAITPLGRTVLAEQKQ